MKVSDSRIVRAGVLAVALGVAAAPALVAAAPAAAAPAQASSVVSPMTVTCGVSNTGPIGVAAYCWGSGAATLTVYCTNGISWGLVFAPSTITVVCPPGGTMIRFTLA
jgi:hypothetical protein